jgi:chromate reductase, NAD(P)H dehydrogenase (quinone)
MNDLSMQGLRLLVIAGSARSASLNLQLAQAAGRAAAQAGAEVQTLDLRALQLPLYDGDLEAHSGVPEGAARLRDAVADAQALLLVTPEYNGFPTPLLINAFDWLSRLQAAGDRPAGLAATAGKPVALLAASPGPLGGLRSVNFLRQYLQMAFAMLVVPQQFALGRANDAFDAEGALKEDRAQTSVNGVLAALGKLAAALHAGR